MVAGAVVGVVEVVGTTHRFDSGTRPGGHAAISLFAEIVVLVAADEVRLWSLCTRANPSPATATTSMTIASVTITRLTLPPDVDASSAPGS